MQFGNIRTWYKCLCSMSMWEAPQKTWTFLATGTIQTDFREGGRGGMEGVAWIRIQWNKISVCSFTFSNDLVFLLRASMALCFVVCEILSSSGWFNYARTEKLKSAWSKLLAISLSICFCKQLIKYPIQLNGIWVSTANEYVPSWKTAHFLCFVEWCEAVINFIGVYC